MNDVKEKLKKPFQHVHYWPDGCGSQFKNKINFGSNLIYHKQDHGCIASWNFLPQPMAKESEEIDLSTYLSILPGDLPPIHSSARFFAYCYNINQNNNHNCFVTYVSSFGNQFLLFTSK